MDQKQQKKQSNNSLALIIILAVAVTVLICLAIILLNQGCKHVFCEKTVYNASCQDKGYTHYLCKTCGYEFDADYIAPLGHNYIEKITPPTCEEQGYSEHVCDICGDVLKNTYVASLGHKYIPTVTPPTCQSEGFTTYTCEACEHSYVSEYTSPVDHKIETDVIPPSCEEQGYTVHSCEYENCDYSYISVYTEPTGHSEKLTVIAPTCNKSGYSLYKCENCEYKYTKDNTSPLGHTYEKTVVEPTCTSQGYTLYSCTRENCGFSFSGDYTSPLDHPYIEKITEPTCTEQGFTTKTCSVCQHTVIVNLTPPKGHSTSATVIEPNCTKEGYTINQCSDCSYSYKNNYTPVTPHVNEKTYVRPNIQQTGYTINTCVNCGNESISDYVWYTDIFTGAEGTGEGELAWGLDLSHHAFKNYDFTNPLTEEKRSELENDFLKLKKTGVDFVILRIGYADQLDSTFEEFYFAAKEAGLDVGVYFFTYAYNADDAKADAQRIAGWIAEIEQKRNVKMQFEYPIFYDIEDVTAPNLEQYVPSKFTKQQLRDMIYAFMTEMVNHNYYPGLYTNNNLLYNVFHTEETLTLYDIWYARYAPDDSSIDQFVEDNIVDFSSKYSMWQYMGDVYGFGGIIEGACDINYAFKDYPSHIKKYGFNGY